MYTVGTLAAPATRLQRSSGAVRLSYKKRGAKTVLDTLYQEGCYKARFPSADDAQPTETVLINTAGGLTDGDQLCCEVALQAGTAALLTTQAAERIYRSRGATAMIRSQLAVSAGATACWLPQETIVFDGARLDRHTDVQLNTSATLFAAESVVFGRTEMGEIAAAGTLLDGWRIRIDGKLVFADSVLFDDARDGHLQRFRQRRAVNDGAAAMATIIYAGPDSAKQLENFRRALARCDVVAGASDLGSVILARILAADGRHLRAAVASVFTASQCNTGIEQSSPHFTLPRVWNC
jgi:urease accessory protein